jgi:hypothetical protein
LMSGSGICRVVFTRLSCIPALVSKISGSPEPCQMAVG